MDIINEEALPERKCIYRNPGKIFTSDLENQL